jgi:Tol biopolymer transport system component
MGTKTLLPLLLLPCCFAISAPAGPPPAKQLTSDPYQNGYAEWTPDGRFVVYTSVQDGKEVLWKVPAKGGEPVRVTEHRSHHARFSPDGAYIVFDGDDGTLVQVMAAAGGTPVRIVPESIPIEQSANPCWSPTSKQIAFHSKCDLWTVELPTGHRKKVFSREGCVLIPVHWPKRENCIIVAVFQCEGRKSDLWKVPLGGGDAQQLTFVGDVMHARVSPDESLIVFSSRTSGNADLWVMAYEGGKSLQLTSDPTHEFEASWSPKGDKLAYTRVTGGQWNIWVMGVDRERIIKELKAR